MNKKNIKNMIEVFYKIDLVTFICKTRSLFYINSEINYIIEIYAKMNIKCGEIMLSDILYMCRKYTIIINRVFNKSNISAIIQTD